MRLRCSDCGFERERPGEEGADLRCPNCVAQGYNESSGTNVRVVDAASVVRVGFKRAGMGLVSGAKRVGRELTPSPFRRHRVPKWAAGWGDEEHPEFCPRCGKRAGEDGSTMNGTYLCRPCATSAMSRRPNVKKERKPVTAEPSSSPAPVRTRPDKSRHTQAILSRIRMNEMRRRADEYAVPR